MKIPAPPAERSLNDKRLLPRKSSKTSDASVVVETQEVTVVCANDSKVTQAFYGSVAPEKALKISTPACDKKMYDNTLQTPEGYQIVLANEGAKSTATRVFFSQAKHLPTPSSPNSKASERSSSPNGRGSIFGTRDMPGVAARSMSPGKPNFHLIEGFRPPKQIPNDRRVPLPPKSASE
jgi:hypothetical protein